MFAKNAIRKSTVETMTVSNLLKPPGEPDDLETCMSGSGGEFAKVPLDGNSVGSYPAQPVSKAEDE